MSTAAPTGGPAGWPGTRRSKAVAFALAATVGFSGAAVLDTVLAQPAFAEATDFGPAGDGRTRLVVTVPGGITADDLAALQDVAGVDSAQPVFDGTALVAGFDITAEQLRAALPEAQAELSVPGEVAAEVVGDPYWSTYGWNLANTGSNSYAQPGVAGADVSAPTGWQAGTGRGVTVAILDTGVMTSHPDLAGAFWRNPDEVCGSPVDNDGNGYAGDCAGWNFYSSNADVVSTGNSHGTTVAGVAGARAGNGHGTAGVAPDVTLMPLVIGSGDAVDLVAGAQAIRYAADNGADVINASWGGTGQAALLQSAIDYANSKGVVVVAAAGNDALNRDTSMFYPASLSAPNLVKVGNSNASDGISESSAYGARSVHLFAPGKSVFTTWNDGSYRLVSGTSIAAPHVAAAFALYRAQDRAASAQQLVGELLGDVAVLPAFAGRSVTGGRLSLSALGGTEAPVTYSFTGMTAQPGTVTPTVVTSGSAPVGEYSVRLALGMEHAGQVYALTRHQVTVGGVTVTTDDNGEATFDLGSRPGPSATVTPSTELAEGRYVLTAQLVRNGTPLGLTYAAPLLVGERFDAPDTGSGDDSPTPSPAPGSDAPAPNTTTPPGSPTPAPAGPTPPGGSTPAPGGTQPGTPDVPGTPAPDGPTPGESTPPGGSRPGTGTPTPGGPAPAPGSDTPAPGGATPPGSSTPAPGSDTPAPGGDAPAPGGATPPGSSGPAPSAPAPGGTSPDLGGRKTYPEVGPFGLVSIDPTRVSTAGGTRVTITGTSIPVGARVRVGSTASATVDAVSATSLSFTTPPRVAGAYDVYVFAPDGTSSVLTGGLTYVDADGGSGTRPGTGTQPDPATQPGTGTQPGTQPGSDAGVTGPNGERLLASNRFTALSAGIWSMDCSRSCSGLAV